MPINNGKQYLSVLITDHEIKPDDQYNNSSTMHKVKDGWKYFPHTYIFKLLCGYNAT